MCTITFLEKHTQVLMSSHGLEVNNTSSENSLFAFVAQNPDQVTIITDAREHAGFCQNPLVTGEAKVVFYAGVALVNEAGVAFGSLSIMDKVTRSLDENQIDSLKILANQLEQLVGLHKKQNELNQINADLSRASEKFRTGEFFYKTMVENGANGVIVFNDKFEISYVSPSVVKILGYSREEAMSLNLAERAHPDDLSIMTGVLEKAFANPGIPIEGSTSRIRHKNGSWRWLDAVVTNMLHDPLINGIVDNFRDVTDKVIADQNLERSEKRFKALVQDGSDLIAILDIDANYIYVSPTSIKVLGIPPESFIGTNAFNYIHPDDKLWVKETFQRSQAENNVSIQPYRFMNSKGQWRWIETAITNLLDEPTVAGFVANSRDVTDKVLKEREFELFNQITSEMASSNGFENRLYVILSRMTDYLEVDCGEIWIVSSDQKKINKVAQYARSKEGDAFTQNQQLSTFKRGEGVLGFIWEVKEHLLIKDLAADTRFLRIDLAQQYGMTGLIGVPIIVDDEVIGILSFFFGEQINISTEALNSLVQTNQRLSTEMGRLISEHELNTFLNLSPGVLSVLSKDGLIIKINASFESEMGYEIGSLAGTYLYDKIPEEDVKATKSALESSERKFTFKNKYTKQNGSLVWLEWQAFKTPDQDIVYAAAKNITRQEELSRLIDLSNQKAKFGTWEIDLIHKRVDISKAVKLIHEIDQIPALEDTIGFYKEGTHRNLLIKNAMDLIEGKKDSFDIEVILVTSSGKELWVNVIAEAEYKDGICHRLFGSVQDIDEKKRTELEIKDVNLRYMLATKTTKLGVWDWDIITDKLTWDEGMFNIYELDKEQFNGSYKEWANIIHPEDVKFVEQQFRDTFQNNHKTFESTYRVYTKSGGIKHINSVAQFILNGNNEPARMIGINHDITDLKEYEAEVTLANYEKTEILESINDGFYTLDENWIITYWNHAAENILGRKKEEVLGKSIWEIYLDAVYLKSQDEFNIVFEEQINRSFEEYYPELNKWFQVNAYPKKNGITVLFRDITESKLLKENLLENSIRSMEKERNRIAQELHDGIVQEMVAAMMHAEHISMKLQKGNTAEEAMPELINLLRKVSNDTRRLSHNLRSPELEKLTLIELIEKLVDQMNNVTSITFYLDIEDELRNLALDNLFKTNIFRVVQELLTNITKHSSASNTWIVIKLIKRSIVLTVEDDGIGFDLTKSNKNPGIGLINMRERVQELNGSIEFENIIPHGLISTVTIKIA